MRLLQSLLPSRPFVFVGKALPHEDLDNELSALENEDEDYVVDVDVDDEPVEKAAGSVKYIRRWRRGNKWRYLYKNAQGHINAKHMLPQEGHQHHVGEAFSDGKGGHMSITHVDGDHVHVKRADGTESRMHKSDLHKHLSEVHKDAMDGYAKHGHERRQAALQKAKDLGSEKHIARAQKELDRFAREHGDRLPQEKKQRSKTGTVGVFDKMQSGMAKIMSLIKNEPTDRSAFLAKGGTEKEADMLNALSLWTAGSVETVRDPSRWSAERGQSPPERRIGQRDWGSEGGYISTQTKQDYEQAHDVVMSLAKATGGPVQKLHRGASMSPGRLDAMRDALAKGEQPQIPSKGIISWSNIGNEDGHTTPIEFIYDRNAGKNNNRDAVIYITASNIGTSLGDLSAYEMEREHIMSDVDAVVTQLIPVPPTPDEVTDLQKEHGFDDDTAKAMRYYAAHTARSFLPSLHVAIVDVRGKPMKPVSKAIAHKFIRKYRRGSKWHYVYPPKKSGKTVSRHAAEATAIAANLIPDEGHQYHKGEMYSAGKGQGHWVVDHADTAHVTVRNDETGETKHLTHDQFRAYLKDAHVQEIQTHIEDGLHRREAVLASAKQIGSTKHIARAEAELKRWRDEHGLKEPEPEPVNVTRTPRSAGEILIFDTERYDTGKKDSDGDPVMGFRQGPNVLAVVKDGLIVESSIPIDESLRTKINDRLFDIEGDREEGKSKDGKYMREALDRSHPSLWIHPHKDWTPKHFIPKFPVTSPPTEQPATSTIQKDKLPEAPKPEPVSTPAPAPQPKPTVADQNQQALHQERRDLLNAIPLDSPIKLSALADRLGKKVGRGQVADHLRALQEGGQVEFKKATATLGREMDAYSFYHGKNIIEEVQRREAVPSEPPPPNKPMSPDLLSSMIMDTIRGTPSGQNQVKMADVLRNIQSKGHNVTPGQLQDAIARMEQDGKLEILPFHNRISSMDDLDEKTAIVGPRGMIMGGIRAKETPAPATRKVYVDSGDRLSNSGFHRSGGKGSGAAHWWLRDSAGNFLPIPRVRGDENFRYNLHLPPGTYTLGTGKGSDAIRTEVVVKPLTQAEQQSARAKAEASNQIMGMIMGGNANPAAQAAVQEGLVKARQQGKEQEFTAAIQQKVEQAASDEGVGVGDALAGFGILSAIGSVLEMFFDA